MVHYLPSLLSNSIKVFFSPNSNHNKNLLRNIIFCIRQGHLERVKEHSKQNSFNNDNTNKKKNPSPKEYDYVEIQGNSKTTFKKKKKKEAFKCFWIVLCFIGILHVLLLVFSLSQYIHVWHKAAGLEFKYTACMEYNYKACCQITKNIFLL